MPAFKLLDCDLYCDRDFRLSFAIYDAAGQAVAIGASDVVYAKLAATEGGAPVIDVGSDLPLGGGSRVTITTRGDTSNGNPALWIPASGTIEFAPADSKPIPNTWTATVQRQRYVLDLSLKDVADANKLKPFGRGTVVVHRSPSGLGT